MIDPGPLDEGHLDAVAAAAGEVAAVLLTHHHFDHSEAARASPSGSAAAYARWTRRTGSAPRGSATVT